MAFDFDALLQNPTFQTGLGLLGAASQRNAPLLNAYNLLASQSAARQKAEEEKSQREMEKVKMDLYKQQIAQSQSRVEMEERMKNRELANAEANTLLQKQIMQHFLGPRTAAQSVAPSMPQGAAPTASITPQADFFTDRILPAEGGMKDGKFLTSPKGAIGPAQVRPATAPEAAKLAGLPFDDARYRSDPQYNIALGRAYFQKQLKDFGGDTEKAAAAYNAGPGALKAALLKAQMEGRPDDWKKHLSSETQDYLVKTHTTPAAAPSGPEMVPELSLDSDGKTRLSIKPSYERQRAAETQRRHEEDVALRSRQIAAQEADVAAKVEEKTHKTNVALAKDKAAYESVDTSAKRAQDAIDDLLKDPALKSISGYNALTNPIAVPGGASYTALAKLKSIQSKLINDTLQSVRQASQNGASGYGQFTEKELEVIKTYVENLDPARQDFPQALAKVKEYMQDIRNRSKSLYEGSTGKKVRSVTRTGKTKDGRKVVQYDDGSIEYGN